MIRHIVRYALISLAIAATPAHAETKLLFSIFFPPNHFIRQVMHEWAADVEKVTGNRVKVEFSAASMAPPPQQMSAVESGIFDVGFTANPFIKNKAPLIEFSSLPWLVSDAEAASVAYWRTYQKGLAAKPQFKGVQLLSLFHSAGGQLYSLDDTPINSIEELKKRKMWALPGEAAGLLKNLGMSPVTTPAVKISEPVSRGVVEGYYGMSPEGALSFKASPYTKVITWFPRAATSTSFSMFINKGKWGKLSKKDQAAVLSVSGEKLAAHVGKAYEKAAADALGKMKAGGIKVVEADSGFYAAMQKAAEPSFKRFNAVATKNGIDGDALVAQFRKEYLELAKH
ncbi:MAG: TRAP transporter substrate-binding protein DctP [Burkholderiales bacterium]|nr:TRAP transporter substrate-binding protein DctP [Burkholderiales bacterium]